jgi:hypothetical protein
MGLNLKLCHINDDSRWTAEKKCSGGYKQTNKQTDTYPVEPTTTRVNLSSESCPCFQGDFVLFA